MPLLVQIKMKKFIIFIIIIFEVFFLCPGCSYTDDFNKIIGQIRQKEGYTAIEKDYEFNDLKFHVYGICQSSTVNLEIIFCANDDISLEWLSPKVKGGSGAMICDGKIWFEKIEAISSIPSTIEFYITRVENNQMEKHLITINLENIK